MLREKAQSKGIYCLALAAGARGDICEARAGPGPPSCPPCGDGDGSNARGWVVTQRLAAVPSKRESGGNPNPARHPAALAAQRVCVCPPPPPPARRSLGALRSSTMCLPLPPRWKQSGGRGSSCPSRCALATISYFKSCCLVLAAVGGPGTSAGEGERSGPPANPLQDPGVPVPCPPPHHPKPCHPKKPTRGIASRACPVPFLRGDAPLRGGAGLEQQNHPVRHLVAITVCRTG